MNCSECKYSCNREINNYSHYGISADCNLICMYDIKREIYVSGRMVCKHFCEKGTPINWNEKRRREYPVERAAQ